MIPFNLIAKNDLNNLLPIAIRIIKDRKLLYRFRQAINKSQWESNCVKSLHPDALDINQLILNRKSKVNKSLIAARSSKMTTLHLKILKMENNSITVILKISASKFLNYLWIKIRFILTSLDLLLCQSNKE